MRIYCAAIKGLAAVLLLATAATSGSKTDTLVKLEEDLMEAISKGGYDAAMPYFADDGALLPTDSGIISGKANIRREMGDLESGETLTWTPVKADIAASEDLGFTYGSSVFTKKGSDGKPVKRYGKYATIWRRQKDGSWKIVVDIGSPSPSTEPET